jgi:uncharacterized membrane protein
MTDDTETTTMLARLKRPLLYVMGAFYIVAGVMHFVEPEFYEEIMPPQFPRPLELVYLSGIAEVVLGIGMLLPRTRKLSAWGIIGLLVAVLPANLHIAVNDVTVDAGPEWVQGEPDDAVAWGRLPLQVLLMLWAWWYTQPMPGEAE